MAPLVGFQLLKSPATATDCESGEYTWNNTYEEDATDFLAVTLGADATFVVDWATGLVATFVAGFAAGLTTGFAAALAAGFAVTLVAGLATTLVADLATGLAAPALLDVFLVAGAATFLELAFAFAIEHLPVFLMCEDNGNKIRAKLAIFVL